MRIGNCKQRVVVGIGFPASFQFKPALAHGWTAKGLTSGGGPAASSGECIAKDRFCGKFLQLYPRNSLLHIALDVLQRRQTNVPGTRLHP